MKLSEIDKVVEVPSDKDDKGPYRIEFAPEPFLVLVAGQKAESAMAKFDHANIVAKMNHVHSFKHYRRGGSKFWTEKAGVDFYFAIPKDRIELVMERGYSYVKVLIGGKKFSLNVSGGGGKTWTDYVGTICHVSVGHSRSDLKVLAENAYSPKECWEKGIRFDLKKPDEHEERRFRYLVAKKSLPKVLEQGSKVVLYNCTYHGKKEGVTVEERMGYVRKRQAYRCKDEYGYGVRVKFSQIDWLKTAEVNGIEITVPEAFNRVGVFKEREK